MSRLDQKLTLSTSREDCGQLRETVEHPFGTINSTEGSDPLSVQSLCNYTVFASLMLEALVPLGQSLYSELISTLKTVSPAQNDFPCTDNLLRLARFCTNHLTDSATRMGVRHRLRATNMLLFCANATPSATHMPPSK
jgi:hypothetical protein